MNNREAGDLRRHRSDYDVIVMISHRGEIVHRHGGMVSRHGEMKIYHPTVIYYLVAAKSNIIFLWHTWASLF